MLRLFVGIAVPEHIAEDMAQLCAGLPGAKWVAPENMHVTLRFIGEMDEAAARDIDDELQRVEAPAFDLSFAGVGTFGQGRKARALWVGVEAPPALAHLQERVESAVVRAGQAREARKFTPHVILARFNRADALRLQGFVEGNNLFRAGPMTVEEFTLFESRMGKGGSVYIPLADYPLGA